MLKQTYNPEDIRKVLKKRHPVVWKLWNESELNDEAIVNISEKICNENYRIGTIEKVFYQKNKYFYRFQNIEDYLAVKLVDYYFRRIYKVQQSDRRRTIRQLKALFADESNLAVVSLDIKNFYESVDFPALIKKVKDDMILTKKGVDIITSFYDSAKSCDPGNAGLLRGIGISATLSELFARDIDHKIKVIEGIIYCTRYVDDIVLVVDCLKTQEVVNKIKDILSGKGLLLNEKKTQICDLDKINFTFLGYSFIKSPPFPSVICNICGKGSPQGKPHTNIIIAENKIKKIKTKIIRALLSYNNDKNFKLLKDRFRYLAYCREMKKNDNGILFAGNCYNYDQITDAKCLLAIDTFLYNACAGNVVKNLQLNAAERYEIRKISFYRAFKDKSVTEFTKLRIKEILKVWQR